jgi:hypothetical protein
MLAVVKTVEVVLTVILIVTGLILEFYVSHD